MRSSIETASNEYALLDAYEKLIVNNILVNIM